MASGKKRFASRLETCYEEAEVQSLKRNPRLPGPLRNDWLRAAANRS
jgi:hypothetical protein